MDSENKAMQVWLDELASRAPGTRSEYLRCFDMFLKKHNLTAEDLYKARKNDLDSDDTRDHRNIERKVAAMMAEMTQEGYSPSYARSISKAVSSFMVAQGLELNMRARDKPRVVSNGQNMALVSDIRIMWREASARQRERNRAIIMVGKDTGLRVSDISNLDLYEYLEAKEVRVNDDKFKVFQPKNTVKTGDIAQIHLGPESIQSIDEYLKVREGNEPALFIDENSKRLSEAAMTVLLLRLGEKTGRNKISAHSLRKFHRTKLEGTGMPEAWVKRLQGKAASVYSLPQQSGDLTNRYIECYHALRIFDEPEKQIKELQEEVKRLRTREEEIEDLRLTVERQGELIFELMKAKTPGYDEVLRRLEFLEHKQEYDS